MTNRMPSINGRLQSLTISLRELVDSGCISKFFFSIGNNINNEEQHNANCPTLRQALNCVEISLLVAKEFAICNDNVSKVQLDHVHVKLSRANANGGIISEHSIDAFGEDFKNKRNAAELLVATGSKHWALEDMKIVQDSNSSPDNASDNTEGKIRCLGELIYIIFSETIQVFLGHHITWLNQI